MRVALLGLLAVFTALFCSPEGTHSAAVSQSAGRQEDPSCPLKMIFMKESEASSLFRRRSRRGLQSQHEINAERRPIPPADERRRELHEEKRKEFESHAEEEQGGRLASVHTLRPEHQNTFTLPEHAERTRESPEPWREFHYDSMYPPQEHNRHHV